MMLRVLLLLLLASPGWAAPTITATASSAQTSNSNTHTITLPTCATGNLLIAILSVDSQTGLTGSWGGSFTRVSGLTALLSEGAEPNAPALDIGYKISAEEANVVYTLGGGATERSAHYAYCLSGFDSGEAPKVTTVFNSDDVPANSPGWGSCDIRWIAGVLGDDGQQATASPTNYSTVATATSTNADSGASLAVANRALTAESEDPGAFTTPGATDAYTAFLLAVKPSSGCSPAQSSTGARRRHG